MVEAEAMDSLKFMTNDDTYMNEKDTLVVFCTKTVCFI